MIIIKNKITLFATITANGFIANIHNEDTIFDDSNNCNWNAFKNLALQYGNIIWGRKTYEMVVSWGENYITDFNNIKLIVISSLEYETQNPNVIFVKTLDEAVKSARKFNLVPFIGGGAKTYSSFLKSNLVDKIILNFNSFFIPDGIRLFNDDISIIHYKIKSTNQLDEKIIQMVLEK